MLGLTIPNAVAQGFYARPMGDGERHGLIWKCVALWGGVLAAVALAIVLFPQALLALLAHPGGGLFQEHGVRALRLAAVVLFLQGLVLVLAAVGNSEGRHTPVALLSVGFPLGGLFRALCLGGSAGALGVLLGVALASACRSSC